MMRIWGLRSSPSSPPRSAPATLKYRRIDAANGLPVRAHPAA
jgi:hypothetical protein